MVLLTSLLSSAIPVQCYGNEVCFQEEPARRLLIDIKTCSIETPLLKQTIELYKKKTEGLEKDKAEYKSQSSQYKKLYIEEGELRQKAESSKPSRAVWFTTGAVASAVAILAGIFMLK